MEKIKEINLSKLVITSLFCLIPISFIVGKLVFEINILLIIIIFISLINKNKFNEVFDKREFLLFLVLVIYLQLNIIISEDWQISFRRNFFYFRFYLLIISFRYFFVNNYFNSKVLNFWILIIFITTFDILYEFVNGQNLLGFQSDYIHRIASFFKDELIVGSFIFALTIPLFSYLYLNKKYVFSLFFLMISFIAIFLSGERSVFIKIILTLIIIFYFWDYKKHLKKFFLLFIIGLLSFSSFFISFDKYFENQIDRYLFSIKRQVSTNENFSIRQNLLETQYINQAVVSYEILKKHPFLGVGNKNYYKACRNYMNENDKKYCFTHPHQVYYEIFSEHGILGALLILIILYKLIILNNLKIKNKSNRRKLLMCGIYLYLSFIPLLPSGSFFSSNMSLLFWINYFFYTYYRDLLIKIENSKIS